MPDDSTLAGTIKPLVGEEISMEQLNDALHRLGNGSTVGRIVVVPESDTSRSS